MIEVGQRWDYAGSFPHYLIIIRVFTDRVEVLKHGVTGIVFLTGYLISTVVESYRLNLEHEAEREVKEWLDEV